MVLLLDLHFEVGVDDFAQRRQKKDATLFILPNQTRAGTIARTHPLARAFRRTRRRPVQVSERRTRRASTGVPPRAAGALAAARVATGLETGASGRAHRRRTPVNLAIECATEFDRPRVATRIAMEAQELLIRRHNRVRDQPHGQFGQASPSRI